MQTIFQNNGLPYFPFGGQCMNSSVINPADRAVFWKALAAIHGNTAEIPVFWETVEPEENKFDFTLVGEVIREAREQKKKLILAWFGTWKNGMMKYVPGWVKDDPGRFRRMVRHDGSRIANLSPCCQENLDADKKAFCELMKFLCREDENEHTVLAVQVENECGTIGYCCRDYSAAANEHFQSNVPEFLVDRLRSNPDTAVSRVWRENGGLADGSWTALFGKWDEEYFAAYTVASYVNEIAGAGKKIYPLPMLVNVWLDGIGFDIPGTDYPAGGPVSKNLDIWKWCAPAIDVIGPDIYIGSPALYDKACAAYKRPDNLLFIPESDCRRGLKNWMNMFSAIGTYRAIGYFAFGIEHILLGDGSERPEYQDFIGSFRSLASVAALLQQEHEVYSVRQEFAMENQYIDAGNYRIMVDFTYGRTDFTHRLPGYAKEEGHGLIIHTKPDEFYVTGGGYTAYFTPKHADIPFSNIKLPSTYNYRAVEEGFFDRDGNWKILRLRTGDESDAGIWVYPDAPAVHVILGN